MVRIRSEDVAGSFSYPELGTVPYLKGTDKDDGLLIGYKRQLVKAVLNIDMLNCGGSYIRV